VRVAFSGSRHLGPAWAPVVGALVAALPAGAEILVGDAAGADALVRQAAPAARVFAAARREPAALVARSVALVRAAAAVPAAGWLVALAGGPCPAGIVPAARWRSGRPASGTWSSAALAAGLGVPVLVVWCAASAVALPAWPGGWAAVAGAPWAPTVTLAAPCSTWSPPPAQPALL